MKPAILFALLLYSIDHIHADDAVKIGGTFDANGNRLYNVEGVGLTSTAVGNIGRTSDVYITKRTDGEAGSGTEIDPFDGSTKAKVDAILANYSSIPGMTIHFGAGTFDTDGWSAWTINDNWTILGAGVDVTILKQQTLRDNSGSSAGASGIIFGGSGTDFENLRVENITLDANWSALHAAHPGYSHSSSFGVNAGNGTLKNVHVINAGGTGDVEVFALGFQSASAPALAIIENCVVDDVDSDNVTAIWISEESNTNPPVGGTAIIRNCLVDGNGSGGIGYQINGYSNGLLEGNTAKNVKYGYFHDTDHQNNLIIANNSLVGTDAAIDLTGASGSVVDHVSIVNNWLEATGASSEVIGTVYATNVRISGNTIINASGNTVQPIETKNDATTNVIEDNLFSNTVANTSGAPLVGRFWNNKKLDGSTISFLADNIVAGLASLDIGGAGTGNKLAVKGADNSSSTNIALFEANNATLGIGIWYNGVRALGSGSNSDLHLDGKGTGSVYLGTANTTYVASDAKAYVNGLRVDGGDGSNTLYNSGAAIGITTGGSAVGLHIGNNTGDVYADKSIRGTAVTFANRPGTPVEGMLIPITDSSTATWGATITGGGSNHVLAYYNGTNWTVAGK